MTLLAIVAPLVLQAVELQEPIVVEIYTRPGCGGRSMTNGDWFKSEWH